MHPREIRASFLKYFEKHGHRVVAEQSPAARRRSDAALHQRRDEPVQGRVPRPREARLHARRHVAEVHARQRQAQRSRQRRAVAAPSHVLRDARQLLVRRLLQARRDRAGLEPADEGMGPRSRRRCTSRSSRARKAFRATTRRYTALAGFRAGRSHRRARHGRQLLGDGRHRPVRPLLGDLRRSRRRRARHRQLHHGRRVRQRALRRDLEQRVHGVRARRQGHAHAAAGAVDRHRHGPRAHQRGDAGHDVELRHAAVHAAARRDRQAVRPRLQQVDVADRRLDARGRRSRARVDVPDRRRRRAVERVARLRAAQDHAARDAPRPQARHARALPALARRRAGPRDGRRVSRAQGRPRRRSRR